ncbi:hypothetical protein [Kytococcus sp. Marseille-QA3725]
MKTLPPALTPFVRSDAVGALLAETLGRPGEESSLAELGRRTGLAPSVVHREVVRLLEGGVLVDRQEGRNRMVRADPEHPLFAPMQEIIAATYGPVPVLRGLLEGIEGVRSAHVFGSWAARRSGETGPFPNDLDLLVVGAARRRDLARAADAAGQALGLEVNVTRLTPEEWEADEPSPFVRTVRSRPLVTLLPVDDRD